MQPPPACNSGDLVVSESECDADPSLDCYKRSACGFTMWCAKP
jgi:hypothetical protein